MNETELKKILQEVYAQDLKNAPREHPDKTTECPPLLRFWELVYQPSTQTPQERAHMSGCRYCQMTLRMCREEEYHPAALLLAEMRQPVSDEAESISFHLESDRCERCLGLIRWFERAGFEWLQGGNLIEYFGWGKPVRTPVQLFADSMPSLPTQQFQSENALVEFTLREDEGEIVFHVETYDPNLNGTLWRIALVNGAGEEVKVGFAVLYPGFDQKRWVAELRFGSLAGVSATESIYPVGYRLEADRLPLNDREALLWSVQAIARDKKAMAAWKSFLEESLKLPLTSSVREMLQETRGYLERKSDRSGPFSRKMGPRREVLAYHYEEADKVLRSFKNPSAIRRFKSTSLGVSNKFCIATGGL